MKVGDVIKWRDLTGATPVDRVGLVIEIIENRSFHDVVVVNGFKRFFWTSWQCEVISESR